MDKKNSHMIHMIAFILVIVGGLNWLLIGLIRLNIVDTLLGAGSVLATLVYVLVGASAIYILGTHMTDCHMCMAKKK